MPKTLFCFICKKGVEVVSDKAIAKLCPEHDTPENQEAMLNTPIRQLLSIQDEGLRLLLNETKNTTQSDLELVLKAIEDIKAKIAALPTETTIIKEVEKAPGTLTSGTVNEFGEII